MASILHPRYVSSDWSERETLSDQDWFSPGSASTLDDSETLSASNIVDMRSWPRRTAAHSEAAWMTQVVNQLTELLLLPPNWDSFGAPPINPEAAHTALLLLSQLITPGTPQPRIVPTAEGGIQLEWFRGGVDLQIEIESEDDITVYYRLDETGESWEGDLDEEPQDFEQLLSRIASSS